LRLGQCYEQLNQAGPALEEYDSILKHFPEEAPAYQARGNLLVKQGQYAPALRDFEKAVELQPASAAAQNLRGVALRMLGRYEEAIAAYSHALRLDPELADALANRAYARKSLGEYPAARDDYDRALEAEPDSAEIQNDLAWLLATCPESAVRNPPRAVQMAETACASAGHKNGDYTDTLAAAYASAGQYPAAVEAAKLALTLLGDRPGAAPIHQRLQLYQQQRPYIDQAAVKRDAPPALEGVAPQPE
jgi:tetratricopeptide (TPR) repeat protein